MARLHKIPACTGTKGGICTYFMRGKFFTRKASSLTAKQVLNEAAFAETRRHSGIMARASKIGSQVYRQLGGKHKTYLLYRRITGQAYKMIKDGGDDENIGKALIELFK